jgi:hypothetical protein
MNKLRSDNADKLRCKTGISVYCIYFALAADHEEDSGYCKHIYEPLKNIRISISKLVRGAGPKP